MGYYTLASSSWSLPQCSTKGSCCYNTGRLRLVVTSGIGINNGCSRGSTLTAERLASSAKIVVDPAIESFSEVFGMAFKGAMRQTIEANTQYGLAHLSDTINPEFSYGQLYGVADSYKAVSKAWTRASSVYAGWANAMGDSVDGKEHVDAVNRLYSSGVLAEFLAKDSNNDALVSAILQEQIKDWTQQSSDLQKYSVPFSAVVKQMGEMRDITSNFADTIVKIEKDFGGSIRNFENKALQPQDGQSLPAIYLRAGLALARLSISIELLAYIIHKGNVAIGAVHPGQRETLINTTWRTAEFSRNVQFL